ncbi:MAG: hypothetical protein E7656_02895 [Ruminococcaceae bacterium]|nr:hypothetical protein [Oscillospiraceae bacterium]
MKKHFDSSKKKTTALIVAAVLCVIALVFPCFVLATDYVPENDPLVTLSYMKDVFGPSLKQEIKDEIRAEAAAEAEKEIEKETETTPEQGEAETAPDTDDTAPVNVGYAVVELCAGQKLSSKNGTVELIVRPGSSAVAFSEIPENGLSDISEMREVLNGEEVGINHAIIIPRNDGRGIVITSDKAYVLVRGDYIVE